MPGPADTQRVRGLVRAGEVRRVVVLAAVLCGLIVGLDIAGMEVEETGSGSPYVTTYNEPSNRLEVLVNQGDGQAFAALAQDPALERPSVFRAGPGEAAYRAQRPLLGWLTWGFSAGRPGPVPAVLVGLSWAAAVALVAVVAHTLASRGASPRLALLLLLAPGVLVTLDWTGPECLGAALAVMGVVLWERSRSSWAAILLIAAALARETYLLVPLALAAEELFRRRLDRRAVLTAAAPFLAYATWVLVVHERFGAWPTDAGAGRLGFPGAGLWDAAQQWSAGDAIVAVATIGVGAYAVVRGREGIARWTVALHLLASSVFGADVWARLEDFSRLLLPVLVFALLSADRRSPSTSPALQAAGPR